MNLRARLLYETRSRPHNVLLVERTQMPETSDMRLQVWVVDQAEYVREGWSQRLDEVLLLLAAGKMAETPVVAQWVLWQLVPLAEQLLKARDTFVKASKAARAAAGVKPDGQT
jgi:hypothetical protein